MLGVESINFWGFIITILLLVIVHKLYVWGEKKC